MLGRLVRLTISRVPTGRKRGGREEPRYLVSEVAKTARLPWQPRLAYRPSSRPDASRLRIEARTERQGPPPHGRELSRVPTWLPSNGAGVPCPCLTAHYSGWRGRDQDPAPDASAGGRCVKRRS